MGQREMIPTPSCHQSVRPAEAKSACGRPISAASSWAWLRLPRVMQSMWEWLSPRLQGGTPIVSRAVHVLGLPEGIIAAPLGEVQAKYPELDIGSYPFYRPTGNGVSIVAKGTNAAEAQAAIDEVTAIMVGFGKSPVAGEPEA